MERTKRYKTDGGDTAWEEKKKQSYATSEVSVKIIYPHARLRLEASPFQVAQMPIIAINLNCSQSCSNN